jgi:uncharacterized protein (UPF0303 family)
MTAKELREIVERQEKKLQFDHFNHEDALDLGLRIVELAKNKGFVIATDIVLNGFLVFRYAIQGTTRSNELWMRNKRNTMMSTGHASIHLAYKLAEAGLSQNEALMPKSEFAVCGGGFPIILKGTGIIGYVCVSGLHHEMDHWVMMTAISEMLGVELDEPVPLNTGF